MFLVFFLSQVCWLFAFQRHSSLDPAAGAFFLLLSDRDQQAVSNWGCVSDGICVPAEAEPREYREGLMPVWKEASGWKPGLP